MGSSKLDNENIYGQSNFGLWRVKIRAILVQQGVVKVFKGEKSLSRQKKSLKFSKRHIYLSFFALEIKNCGKLQEKIRQEKSGPNLSSFTWLNRWQIDSTWSKDYNHSIWPKKHQYRIRSKSSTRSLMIFRIQKSNEWWRQGPITAQFHSKKFWSLQGWYTSWKRTNNLSWRSAICRASQRTSKEIRRKSMNTGEWLFTRWRSDKRDSKGSKKSWSRSVKNGNGWNEKNTKTPFKCFQCHKEGNYKRITLSVRKTKWRGEIVKMQQLFHKDTNLQIL